MTKEAKAVIKTLSIAGLTASLFATDHTQGPLIATIGTIIITAITLTAAHLSIMILAAINWSGLFKAAIVIAAIAIIARVVNKMPER